MVSVPWPTRFVQSIRRFITAENEDRELLLTTSRNVIFTTGVLYMVWHFSATLAWPDVFSPSQWDVTLVMAAAVSSSISLLPRSFPLAQVTWFSGLFLAILGAYWLYQAPIILLFLTLTPMIAATMVGLFGALLVEAGLIALLWLWPALPFFVPIPEPYLTALYILSIMMVFLGWGLSSNLLSAIEASSYHYRLALQHLEEARQHRAEISVLNKELTKSNFQLNRLNKALSYAHLKAEEAREERDRFAMAVSHELRHPLNFIIGFSDLMVNSPETYAAPENWPPGLFEDVQQVYQSAIHLHALINDILDMGKIDARQMVLFREKTALDTVIESVRTMAEPVVLSKDLYFRVEVDSNLPPLYIDRTRIRQVLINLVTNALRFTERGGITIRAYRELDESAAPTGMVRVEVEDSGAGIADEDIPKIFNEFRQVGNESWRRKEGTGLGLSIGQRFIKLHNGEMNVQSMLGKGSCFYFTLPMHEAPVTELDSLPNQLVYAAASDREATRIEQAPLILFLSPDPFWARIFGETLANVKVILLSAPDQLETACAQYYPKAILIDQNWADHEAVQKFLAHPPYDLPAIVLPLPVNLNRVTNLPEGVVRYLLKPVSSQTLREAVQSLPGSARRLLVVDDDLAMLRFLTQSMRSAGEPVESSPDYELLVAANGSQAIELLRTEKIDAILLDLDLPDISGLEVIERLQTDPTLNRAPIIIVSANDLPQNFELRQQGNLALSIPRPFKRQELADAVMAILEKISTEYRESEPLDSEMVQHLE